MIKIKALSDVHGQQLSVFNPQGAKVCFIAGDIAPIYQLNDTAKANQLKWIADKFCPYIAKFPKTEFVFVAGNHDFWGEKVAPNDSMWPKNAHYLNNSSCKLDNGMVIWGTPLVNPVGTARWWAFETTAEEQRVAFMGMPKDATVVLSHTPPRFGKNMIDVPCGAIEFPSGKPRHLGSVELARAVKQKKPQFLFCGHIHSGDHHPQVLEDTMCWNVSVLDEEYNMSFYPLAMDI